jgi:murein DD-endopeptidase MepM/ murein hydrolase activator NlpD
MMHHKIVTILFILAFVFSPSPVIAQDDPGDPVYIVQSGDTLSSIAVRFGIPVDDLLSANGITDPNSLGAGQSLVLPGLEGISGTLINETVPLGDSLRSISLKNAISIPLLTRLNRIVSPLEVYAGVSLIVPEPQDKTQLSYAGSMREEQSLLEFAVLKGSNVWSLKQANELTGTWDALPGETLFSPNTDGAGLTNSTPLVEGLDLEPLPIIQGGTSVVRVRSTVELELTGSAAGQILHFHKNAEDEYVALLGTHAMSETGLTQLVINGASPAGDTIEIEQMVLLAPGNYAQEYVEGVDSNTISADVIESEEAILAGLVQETSDKLWTGTFNYPVDEPCLASPFGNRRSYNNGSYFYYHTGQDFTVCAQNLNIYSVANGKVIFTGPLDIKGNFTLIDHGWGVYTAYAHQSEVFIEQGQFVESGQLIGQIGNTGRSVGPHLHFEVWVDGIPVDPYDWLTNTYP